MNEETERAFWRWYNMSQQTVAADTAKGIFNAGFNSCATLDLSLDRTSETKIAALTLLVNRMLLHIHVTAKRESYTEQLMDILEK